MMEEKRLGVYQVKNVVFIQAFSETVHGVHRLDGSVLQTEAGNIKELGENILKALENCKVGIPHLIPKEYNSNDCLMIKETKMKNWSKLEKSCLSITISWIDSTIKFLPKRFKATRPDKGYYPIDNKAIETEDLSPENLGRCLVEALARSENPFLKV